jgi:nitrate reductase alpha subunit
VRSTHGVNCTGSCSWKIYVKGGIVTWETQQTDYPRTRWDMPNHEPRGCARGASYSWYLYSANRVKYPMVRGRPAQALARSTPGARPGGCLGQPSWKTTPSARLPEERGLGGFVRSTWDEVNEIIAAANVYTIKKHGPDRIIGFSPIPAMSMVSYAAGSRYLSLIGGVCMSFYDWYCDLPPSSPQVWGEQTDVPESADWYNSSYIIAWGSNVPQTRTPDAHFFTEVRYKGTKTVAITPDYSEVAKLADIWMHPKQGTDAAVAMAMGHVILKEFYFPDKRSAYFDDYVRRYTDMPMLVMLKEHTLPGGEGIMVPDRYVRASDFNGKLGQANNPEWKTVAYDDSGKVVLPNGAIGFRWGRTAVPTKASGTWRPRRRPRQRCQAQAVGAGRRAGRHETARWASRTSAASCTRASRTTWQAGDTDSKATCWCARCPCSASRWARRSRSARPGGHRVRPAGRQLRRGRGLPGELAMAQGALTTTPPTPRPGRKRSPARRASS